MIAFPASRAIPQSPPRPLGPLPASATGQKLAALFPNGWDWIYSPAPSIDEKPDWQTITRYPLTPIEQERLHQDPEVLIGIRPNTTTRWGVIDIDIGSPYHPSTDPTWLPKIQAALEAIGLPRTLICQSSHSGGLHLYIPLPEPVSSFWLSICLKLHLEAIGINLKSGQCEIYPNPKRWIPQGQGFSKFAALRLPMQPNSGFLLLDSDLNPIPATLDHWLIQFETSAAQQDLATLEQSIAHSKETYRLRRSHQPQTLESWQARIDAEKQQGWTGPGQTNEKLKLFGCEARVFLGMDSVDQIAEHIEHTALNSPGFHEHSNHIHNLKQRSREVAHWVMNFYWPNGTPPQRRTGYHSPQTVPADFAYHQAKRDAAHHRIEQAVTDLTASEQLSNSITERANQLTQHAHVSLRTLYKPHNLALWHPDHQPTLESPKPAPLQDIFQPPPEPAKIAPPESPKPLLFLVLFQLLIYVGFVISFWLAWAAAALAPQGQRAAKADPPHQPNINTLPEGGTGGINPILQLELGFQATPHTSPEQWAQLKSTLPPDLQRKITQAEKRQSKTHSSPPGHASPAPPRPSPSSAIARPQPPPIELFTTPDIRGPSALESAEFDTWFTLAIQLHLVSDSEWDNGQYWVESKGHWLPYTELSATFSTRTLKRMLSG